METGRSTLCSLTNRKMGKKKKGKKVKQRRGIDWLRKK